MKVRRRDRIKLWRDSSLPDGMELLCASCYEHAYPAHFHDEFVIAAFSRGAQRHRILRREGVAEAGTLMIIHPGELHAAESAEPETGWDYCAFYPSARFMNSLADDVLGGQGDPDFGKDFIRRDLAVTQQLQNACSVATVSHDILEKECALYEAFGSMMTRYGERPGIAQPGRMLRADIRRSLDHLQSSYMMPVSISEVAIVAGLSEYHFMRVFRAATGLSVHRYLTQIRLGRAKDMLSSGAGSAEVAAAVGLFDQSHLIRLFRNSYGVTPADYAALCR